MALIVDFDVGRLPGLRSAHCVKFLVWSIVSSESKRALLFDFFLHS